MDNYYRILGVHYGATKAELTAARRTVALANHPDRCPGDDAAAQRMAIANVAFDVLSDPKREKIYRLQMAGRYKPCVVCDGRGYIAKQRGFKAVDKSICPSCAGSGLMPKVFR